MIEESKYSSDFMKKSFNKKLVMTKKDFVDFENSAECWICDNVFVDCDVKVRNHYYVTWKYIGSANRDCNIKVKLSHKVLVVFRNLKNYDS